LKSYNVSVTYDSDVYTFIVETMQCNYRNDINQLIVTEIRRFHSPLDCGKKLKKSDIKIIRKSIEDIVLKEK
jgi:hypothetical protein